MSKWCQIVVTNYNWRSFRVRSLATNFPAFSRVICFAWSMWTIWRNSITNLEHPRLDIYLICAFSCQGAMVCSLYVLKNALKFVIKAPLQCTVFENPRKIINFLSPSYKTLNAIFSINMRFGAKLNKIRINQLIIIFTMV